MAIADWGRPLHIIGDGPAAASDFRTYMQTAANVITSRSVILNALKTDEVSYDPYARHRPLRTGVGKRTDLRKLSEWIKKMRELEERKRTGVADPEEE